MKATLLFKEKFSLELLTGENIVVYMDLYRLPEYDKKVFVQGYKFSWIAFNPTNPEQNVLFDCHPSKGPHKHIDNGEDMPLQFSDIDDLYEQFFLEISKRFGELQGA